LVTTDGIWLLGWLACAVLAGVIGASKDEGFLAFVAGLLFGPLGVLFAIFSRGHRRPCPKCREPVHRKATRCPHCQSDLPEGWDVGRR
ncbi:MAG: hypothetical protein IT379_19215, partial [Deltaproteobacteria bacterium]|nr:hypothetical protein [Deltaproteobacteria bacterium]